MSVIERFDIAIVTEEFNKSLQNDDDVALEEYIKAYEEINKFFQLMGTVFGFVSSDIRAKIDILVAFRSSNEASNFSSIKTMIHYEKEANLLNEKNYVSGSRTLLRLHRGLEFVYEFLLRLQELSESDKTHNVCKSSYNDTLAKHHPFLIRKGALVAMYAMPTKEELLKRVCLNVQEAKDLLPEMLKNTRMVYDRTHELYTKHDLHNLP